MTSVIFTWSGGPARRRVDLHGGLAEVLRTDGGWRDHADCLRFAAAAVVVEPLTGAPRNAKCLPGQDVDWFSVDSPGQHSVDTVDRLFIMVVAVRRRRNTLRARDSNLKCRHAAIRISLSSKHYSA